MATKTINLTGAEVAVTGLDGAHAHIRNDGTDTIYAAKTAGITAGADGVASIPAGQDFTLCGISGTVHLLGTGSVQLVSNDYVPSPFGDSTASGGSAVDEVARAAASTHAGNAEIHVTAENKAKWNGKAELADIPTELPANGGNADTLDGKHADDFIYAHGYLNGIDLDDIKYPCSALAIDCINRPPVDIWGTLLVYAGGTGSFTQIYIPTADDGTPTAMYFRHHGSTGWTSWSNTADGGNAAMLESHPASDFVLKSDYDALAARVAALENGGTT